jgi:imidazolonepropionase-like amidohydrolase
MRITRSAIFISLLVAAGAVAEEPASLAIHSRHVLDIRGGTASEGYVVVHGDRIVSIDRSAPKGMRVIELGDATVLPGVR